MEIRRASLLHLSDILVTLNEMYEEPKIKPDEVDWHKVAHTLVTSISKGLVLIAITDDNELAGIMGGDISSQWYSNEMVLGDYFFFVRQEFRKSPAAFKLMKEFKSMATKADLPMQVGHVLGEDTNRKDKMFEKLGFTRLGSIYKRGKGNGRDMPAER